MSVTTIEWTDYTFNPWIGCTKVSPGCAHCYAETLMDTRYGRVQWGAGKPRVRTSAANWKLPIRWNKEASMLGVRKRVFCASLADWLDDEVDPQWLADLLGVIAATPDLDWQLLTKRPQNFRSRIQAVLDVERAGSDDRYYLANRWLRGQAPTNVWIGTTVEDQERANERIPELLKIPARVRFLSCEPLLGLVRLSMGDVMAGFPKHITSDGRAIGAPLGIHWVICGGESGQHSRPIHPDWARSLRDQCATAGVPFLFKQWGEWTAAKILSETRFELQFHKDCAVPKKPEFYHWPDQHNISARVGKHKAGRLLDGVEHNSFPEVSK